MIKSSICFICLLAVSVGCSSHLALMQDDSQHHSLAVDEMRMELSDLKHQVSNTQVELQILDEKVKVQDKTVSKAKGSSLPDLSSLERRLSQIERQQEKVHAEIKQLSQFATQTSSALSQYRSQIVKLEEAISAHRQNIDDLSQVKSTLSSISASLKGEQSTSTTTYKVRAGDSLEKIARINKVSVESIKKANTISQNKILIGQELIIPDADTH